jgi:phosphohistidine phosphatase
MPIGMNIAAAVRALQADADIAALENPGRLRLILKFMKTIYLLRHAEAGETGSDMGDSERALTQTGQAQARLMARRMRGLEKRLDLVFTSPAVRAMQTARAFRREYGLPKPRQIALDCLYEDFSLARFFKELRKAAGQAGTVLVVGHNPALSGLAQALVPAFQREMAKAALFGCRAEVAGFEGFAAGPAEFLFYEEPGAEFAAYRSLRAEAEAAAGRALAGILRRDDRDELARMEESIEKAAHRFALKLLVKAPLR